MSDKIIINALLLFAFLGITLQSASGQVKATPKTPEPPVDYHANGAPMPDILLITFDSIKTVSAGHWYHKKEKSTGTLSPKLVTGKDLDNGANLLVMRFNPTCGHCEEQTDLFEKNIALFKKSNLVLIANSPMIPYMPDFIRNHHVKEYPKIVIGIDSSGYIGLTNLYSSLPQINIYGPDRKLIRAFCGEVSLDTLKQYIQ